MTKLLATTILLLTLLVSPLIAKEKILRCDPAQNQFHPSSYYKMKTSFFMFKSYYLRIGEKWMPFCKGEGSAVSRSTEEIPNKEKPVEIIKGDNAVSCVLENRTSDTNELFYDKVKIDFDTNSSTYCHENTALFIKAGRGDVYKSDYVTFECHKVYANLKCEVLKD